MSNSLTDTITGILRELTKIDYIRPGEFPNIDLYMDQVTTFMNTHMSASKIKSDDVILTKTMINNYAKNNLIPPPDKKKYSKEHMIILVFIYYFKSILSISEIHDMLGPLCDSFFDSADNKSGISMEDIYNVIYASTKSQLSTVSIDIMKKSETAGNYFNEVTNKKERVFLQRFAVICMLSFDVFLKKQLIQCLIDTPGDVSKSGKTASSKNSGTKQTSKKSASSGQSSSNTAKSKSKQGNTTKPKAKQ